MRLAPNPATTEVMVTVEGLTESGGTIMGFDAQGRVVWQWSSVQRPASTFPIFRRACIRSV